MSGSARTTGSNFVLPNITFYIKFISTQKHGGSEVGMNKQSLQCFLRKSSRCNVKRKGLLGIFPKSLSVRRTFANRRLLKYVKKIKNRSQRKVKTFVLVGSRTAQPVEAWLYVKTTMFKAFFLNIETAQEGFNSVPGKKNTANLECKATAFASEHHIGCKTIVSLELKNYEEKYWTGDEASEWQVLEY